MRPALISAFVLAGALTACGGSDGVPYPADASLVERFSANRAAFEGLLANPMDPESQSALGITQARVLPDSSLHFLVWYHDLPGPGGCAKGFAYLREAPRSRVDAIGDQWARCPPEEAELFRQLEGNWYIYLTASN